MRLTIRSPSSGDVLGSVPVLDEIAVKDLVAKARSAQPAWKQLGIKARADLILKFRARMVERAEDVARLSSAETGKLTIEAMLTDVQVTCDLAKWYARRAPSILNKRSIPSGWLITKRAYEVREPYGVVGVIGPWNFPVLNCMRSVLSALVCGNTVVLKPSEASPLCALLMREIATEAGIPDDVFVVVTGDGATGAALVEADIDKLCFTGSVETGRRIAQAAATRLLPLSLELGGKDPMIVLSGADVDRAADAAVAGAFLNAGQICTSIERVYVQESVYDDFLRRVLDKTKNVQVGAITVEMQIEKIESQVNDAVHHGARILTGGGRRTGAGRYYAPTVLADVKQDMRIMREETFGPVLPVMKVRDAEEAIERANDSPFALGGSIWAKRSVAEKLVPRLQAGMVSVNDTLLNGMMAGLPFGGLKESGYGRVYGDDALREMSWPRGVTVDRAGMREIAYYPLERFGDRRALGLVELVSGSGIRKKIRGLMKLLFAFLIALGTVTAAQAQTRKTPDLVVFIAVDQMRGDYLDRFAKDFTGGFKRFATEGAFFTKAYQDHAVTETAVGHASMLSGRFPRHTGIVSNESGVLDPQSPLIVGRGTGASPFRFRGGVLMDWIRTYDAQSRGLSVSRKDRAAILPMGRSKQSVFWYSPTGQFTTSKYYADTLPTWVKNFNAQRIPQSYGTQVWNLALDVSRYPEPDSVPYESGGRNFLFPHRFSGGGDTAAAQLASFPFMDEVTARFALAGLDEMKLGKTGHVDVMSVSFSTTDAIGHQYGPDSRELHDQIIRLDRILGALIDSINARFQPGQVVYALTSDHGVMSYPQTFGLTGLQAQVNAKDVVAKLPKWAELESGMLIINRPMINNNQVMIDSVAKAFAADMRKVPHIARVDFVADLDRLATKDDVSRRWANMIPRDLAIPVVVTLEKNYRWDYPNSATHGTPYELDAWVPIVFMGEQFKAGRYATMARTIDIAPTLAAVLRIKPAEEIDGKILQQAIK